MKLNKLELTERLRKQQQVLSKIEQQLLELDQRLTELESRLPVHQEHDEPSEHVPRKPR